MTLAEYFALQPNAPSLTDLSALALDTNSMRERVASTFDEVVSSSHPRAGACQQAINATAVVVAQIKELDDDVDTDGIWRACILHCVTIYL